MQNVFFECILRSSATINVYGYVRILRVSLVLERQERKNKKPSCSESVIYERVTLYFTDIKEV